MKSLCYIILTHNNLTQTAEIIKMLDSSDIGFIVHIDKKCKEDPKPLLDIPSVKLAEKRFDIVWGDYSMVDAVVSSANQALEDSRNFNYFILLSGQCLPVKNADYIKAFFLKNEATSYLKAVPIPSKDCEWLEGGRRRIECYPIRLSARDISLIEPRKLDYGNLRQIGKTLLTLKFSPIREMVKTFLFAKKRPLWTLPTYGGEFWWRMNRHLLKANTDYLSSHQDFKSQIENTGIPDEIIFNTLSYNLETRIENDIHTFINWKGDRSPDWITMSDKDLINDLIKNPQILFCRKVKDLEVIEYVKRKLDSES